MSVTTYNHKMKQHGINKKEFDVRLKHKNDFTHFSKHCLKIRTKEGAIKGFALNTAQKYVHQKLEEQKISIGKVRALVLKARQQGISTYIGGRFYHQVIHRIGVQAFIIAHELEATNNLFKMAKRFYEFTPEFIRPDTTISNTKELIFGNIQSGYKLGTAQNKAAGRSATIQYLHGSEVAFWPNAVEHAKGLFQTVPDLTKTEIILESTANGQGNFFHQQWQLAESGQSDYIAIFIPWIWQEEYKKDVGIDFVVTPEEKDLMQYYHLSVEQIAFRRMKISEFSVNGLDGEKAFMQEYPINSVEAFTTSGEDSFIESELVVRARKCLNVEKYGAKILGVDPARFGDDRTAIIKRQGRKAFDLQTFIKKDTMEVTGIVNTIIQEWKPDAVMIDVAGLGAGVVDRLNELGYKGLVHAVNGGNSSLKPKQYYNKRCELWGEMKEWLTDEPCSIPDLDELQADLCNLKYSFDSNTRLKLEKKEDMKKRGLRSCDTADALSLTFEKIRNSNIAKDNEIAAKLMKSNNLGRVNTIYD